MRYVIDASFQEHFGQSLELLGLVGSSSGLAFRQGRWLEGNRHKDLVLSYCFENSLQFLLEFPQHAEESELRYVQLLTLLKIRSKSVTARKQLLSSSPSLFYLGFIRSSNGTIGQISFYTFSSIRSEETIHNTHFLYTFDQR